MNQAQIVKVNLGCGPSALPDWINIDWGVLPFLSRFPLWRDLLVAFRILPPSYNLKWPSGLRLHDCRKRLPFEDHTVDYVYTSHFLEHLYPYEAFQVLKDCRRVLRPGGILRVCVPDIKILSESYLNGNTKFFKSADPNVPSDLVQSADFFAYNIFGFNTWTKPTFLDKLRRFFTRGHLWVYDYDSLESLLSKAGFASTKRCEPGGGEVPDIERLDIHRVGSVFVEGTRE